MKSSKFRFSRLVALIIVMTQLLSLSTILTFASSDDDTVQQTETIISDECTITDESSPVKDTNLEPKRELKPIINFEKIQ